jgi:excisionase family DNA binding protein
MNARNKSMPSILTVAEVARYLHVHPTTIYRLAKAGAIPAFKIGADWRFSVEVLNRWQRRQALGH